MLTLLSLGLAVAIGILVVRLARPTGNLRPRWAGLVLEISLGAGTGVAVTSFLFFVLLLVGAASRPLIWTVEVMLLSALGLLCFRRGRSLADGDEPPAAEPPPGFRWNWMLAVALAAGLLLVVLALVDTARVSPHGNWDAWGIWNLRAKFLAGPDQTWRNAFSPMLERTHPDYPLLLSSFVARLWKSAGEARTPLAPLAAAFLFFPAVLALLLSSLALLRGLSSGLLACLIVVATPSFLMQPMTLYADVPLGFYYLGVLVLVFLASDGDRHSRAALVLTGAFASFAAWTKNEGVLFLGIVLAGYLLVEWRTTGVAGSLAKGRSLLVGVLPGVAIVAYFKLLLAPPSATFTNQTAWQALQKFADFSRHAEIAKAVFTETMELGGGLSHPLILVAVLAVVLRFDTGRHRKAPLLFGALTLVALSAFYLAAYAVTTADLAWHLGTSLGRLYSQLWPGFLFLIFMVLWTPAGTEAEEPAAGHKAQTSRKVRKKPHA